ncbi:MAG: BatD family protein [Myxococcales bacterium]|nr:BatD family protein [Myxococcales bacterium]
MNHRRASWLGGVVAALVAAPSSSHAAVFLTVEAEPLRAQVGQAISVRYSVRTRDQGAVQIMPLNFGALQLLSDPSPPQVPMMWGTGMGFSMETSTEYLVRAPRPGRYTITSGRAIDTRSGRVIAQAPPVTIVVGDAGAADDEDAGAVTAGDPDASAGPPADPDAPPNGDLSGAYYDMVGFYRVGVSRPRAYLGEQLEYRVWAYSASPDAGCEVSEEPTFPGFWNEVYSPPTRECAQRWFSQQVNGRFMAIGLVRKYGLFATQTGVQRFGSVVGRIDVMTGGMFRQVRRAESRTPLVELTVIEPPVAGRPEGYVPGTIGPVALEATIDRANCPVGETATISVRAVSEGSLASAQLRFERNVDGARVRAAEGRTVIERAGESGRFRSTRTMELLVVPERPGDIALGEASLAYWDPVEERYGVARVALPSVRASGERVRRENEGTAQEDPARVLRGLSASPSLRGYSPVFQSARVALGTALLPTLAAGAFALGRAGLRWKKRADAERVEGAKNDPESLLREAQRALATDAKQACALCARAIERAKAEARDAEVELSDAQNALVSEATSALEAVRFAGTGSAEEAVSRSEKAVRAIMEATR